MARTVRKAVFPAAGLGTRFLPATKSQPKETLPVVDKPIIQYGVEEAVASGIENVIIVTGRGKSAIEDHFDVSFELEHALKQRPEKCEELQMVQAISDLVQISYVRQKEALGLGHAVACAKDLVSDEPFAVMLVDDLIRARTPGLKQLINIHEYFGAAVLAVMEVPKERISAYGVVAADPVTFGGSTDRLYQVRDLVEKPAVEDAPSNLAVIGRYILPPEIFGCIESTGKGRGGEYQLTDAIKKLIPQQPVYAYRFEGERFDTGDKLGFLQATVDLALRREDLGARFREYLKSLEL